VRRFIAALPTSRDSPGSIHAKGRTPESGLFKAERDVHGGESNPGAQDASQRAMVGNDRKAAMNRRTPEDV
jgi:hypothetical protein